jgi:CheY-like chemotaxis protein
MQLAVSRILPTIAVHMSAERKVILSLEDNPDITSLIRLVLRHAPANVLQAQSAVEAWPMLEGQMPDLILLDMMLPGMNGLDFLSKLRADPRFRAVPVIVVSIRSDASFRQKAQELGVFRYLLKPFSPAVLRQEIEQALGVDWKKYWSSTLSQQGS